MSYNPSPRLGAVTASLRPRHALPAVAATSVAVLLGSSAAFASNGHTGFGFNAPSISGGSGSVFLTGGGAYDSTSSGFVHSAGGFKCTSTVSGGPLVGCLAGQGVRWDTAALLQSTPFKCTATDPSGVKTATTTDDTAVLRADFYRAGDGNNESFTANMFVSTEDLAPDVPGFQNVWVQGVGCGSAVVHFSH